MYVEQLDQDQIDNEEFDKMFVLWWSDFEEAGIEALFVAFDDNDSPIGFQTVDRDGLCVAIEVSEKYQGKGIARMLVEESGCWRPADNQCPDFWEKMAEEFGW